MRGEKWQRLPATNKKKSGGIQTRNWVDKNGNKQSRVIVGNQAFKSTGATAGGKAKYRLAGAAKNKSNGGAGG